MLLGGAQRTATCASYADRPAGRVSIDAPPVTSVTNPTRRIALFGIDCRFTALVLERLLASPLVIATVVLPHQRSGTTAVRPSLPLLLVGTGDGGEPAPVLWQANESGVPILPFPRRADPSGLAALSALELDAVAVACFPWRIQPEVIATGRWGGLNLHPSLLPRWRGPAPIFWTLEAGDPISGVTVHVLDEDFDSGDIVAQAPFAVEPGTAYDHLEREAALRGAAILEDALLRLPASLDDRRPQKGKVSWAPVPGAANQKPDALDR